MSGNTDAEKGNFAVKAGLAQVRDSHSRELTRFSTRCLFFVGDGVIVVVVVVVIVIVVLLLLLLFPRPPTHEKESFKSASSKS